MRKSKELGVWKKIGNSMTWVMWDKNGRKRIKKPVKNIKFTEEDMKILFDSIDWDKGLKDEAIW